MSSSAIVVGIRVRPFNQREIKYGSKCIINMEGNVVRVSVVRQGKIEMVQPKEFIFDHALWTHSKENVPQGMQFADQQYVYERVGRGVLANVMEGFNSCLFAYGQTGSGKTYSMMGVGSDPGVLPRLGNEMFAELDQRKEQKWLNTVECSFCEIYNEKVRDLMEVPEGGAEPKVLQVRQHPKLGIFVQGLQKFKVKSAEEFSSMLDAALSHRAVASTNMNSTSSRSHAIVLISVAQKDPAGRDRTGKLSLVDLAGSERSTSTGATGSTAVEGNNINLSLTNLGMVLSRLADAAEGKTGGLHIPYRDSALTFLLSDNLGGNSKTAMLANISPASLNYDETISTLRFAQVTRKVKTVAVVNEDPVQKKIRQLKEELSALQATWSSLQVDGEASSEMLEDMRTNELAIDDMESTAVEYNDAVLRNAGSFASNVFASPDMKRSVSMAGGDLARQESTLGDVFVDWKLPHLINLTPDTANDKSVLSVALREGTQEFTVEDETLSAHFDALANQVTIFGSQIFLNGDAVPDEGAVLRHQDRIVVGSTAFRFAHASGLSKFCDYNPEPTSVDHILLLERFNRWTILEERSKDALAIGKMFLISGGLTSPSASPSMMSPVGSPENSRRGGGPSDGFGQPRNATITPRSTNPILAAIGDDLSMSNQLVFNLERDLATEYPAPEVDVEENYGLPPPCTYDDAIGEMQEHVKEKDEYIAMLQEKLSQTKRDAHVQRTEANKLLDESEMSQNEKDAILFERESALQPDIDDDVMQQWVDTEFTWHKKLKKLRRFNDAPEDKVDHAMWERLTSNPPFLGDPVLQIIRSTMVNILDPVSQAWEAKCIAASKRFVFIFKKADGRERCTSAVYLLGVTLAVIEDDAKFILEVTPPCPKSPMDKSVSASMAQVRMAFSDDAELREWKRFMEGESMPKMPLTLRKRFVRENLSGVEGVRVQHMDITANIEVTSKHSNWKPDSEATHCALCKAKFRVVIRRKHHCRKCGDIFCADCVETKDSGKVCKTCMAVWERESSFVSVKGSTRNSFAIKNTDMLNDGDCLIQDYWVRLDSPESEEILFRVDLLNGRAHTCLADDLHNAQKSANDTRRLDMLLTDQSLRQLYFRDALDREHAYEAIMILTGHRVYCPPLLLPNIVGESDVIVEVPNEYGTTSDALLRTTSEVLKDAKVWVGIEDGRQVPFYRNWDFWVVVGCQETWSESTLDSYGLHIVASAPVHKNNFLYVIVNEDWRERVLRKWTGTTHTRTDMKIASIGIQLLETSVLFIGVQKVFDSDFDVIGETFSLESVSVMNVPAVDPIQQCDHVVVVGAPEVQTFTASTSTGNVQYRSNDMIPASVLRAERSSTLFQLPVINCQLSHGAFDRRLLVEILCVKTSDGLARLAQSCQLWASIGFERCDDMGIMASPERGEAEEKNRYASLLFANGLPEYVSMHSMYIVFPEMGSASLPIATFTANADEKTVSEHLVEVYSGAVLMNEVIVEIRSEWVVVDSRTRPGSVLNSPRRASAEGTPQRQVME